MCGVAIRQVSKKKATGSAGTALIELRPKSCLAGREVR